MALTVTKLHVARPELRPRRPELRPRAKRASRHQLMSATAIGAVAVTLTALSLNHLASGIGTITHAGTWQAWAMAIGVDCAFVACELAQLAIGDKLRTRLAGFFGPAIVGTLAWSAVLNALAFASAADGTTMQSVAIALGVSIPALIYALTKIGAAIYLDTTH